MKESLTTNLKTKIPKSVYFSPVCDYSFIYSVKGHSLKCLQSLKKALV